MLRVRKCSYKKGHNIGRDNQEKVSGTEKTVKMMNMMCLPMMAKEAVGGVAPQLSPSALT